jgi:hypothetical protein
MTQSHSSSVDFGYLEEFAAGDRVVVGEVLNLFLKGAPGWADGLDAANPGWPDLVHTIKGSARGIGALTLAEAAARAETQGAADLPAVKAALKAAAADIAAYLARPA